jgi:serine/threonine-protein kinase RsbW
MWEPASGDSMHTDLLLDSTLESVDKGEALVMDAAKAMGFDEDNLHELGIAVRESLVNAVAHGNRYSAKKKVQLRIWKGNERLAIEIGDEGNGFEVIGVPDPLAEENLLKQSGRGILMIQAFTDEFHVRKRDPAGTAVTLVKYLHT